MELTTKLSMHQRVITLIEGRLVSLEIDEINFRIIPANEKDGGKIEYSGIRRDRAVGRDASPEASSVKFSESDLGVTVWRDKEEMLSFFGKLEIETDFWK